MLRKTLISFLSLFLIFSLTSCFDEAESQSAVTQNSTQSIQDGAAKDKATNKHFLPQDRFTAKYLDGSDFDSVNFQGNKLLLGFFSFKHKDAAAMLKNLMALKGREQEFNYKIILVSIDSGKASEVQKFLSDNKVELPTILETSALELATKFSVEHEVALIGTDVGHKPAFGIKKYVFSTMPDGDAVFLDYLKENLSIKEYHGAVPRLGIFPEAPDFNAKTLDGKDIKLSSYRGKNAVLVLFFSPKCPHCQHEMKYLHEEIYPQFQKEGLEIIALSVLPLVDDTLKLYQSFNFKWPVIDDHRGEIRTKYSKERSIPENFFVDKLGKVKFHSTGYSEEHNNLTVMRIKSLLGMNNPPLLSEKKYNGAESCMICHEQEYMAWSVTPHAHAWQTLQIKGEDLNPECVGCHSVGFNDPKGFQKIKDPRTGKDVAYASPTFQNVQCENCHGVGGPHVTLENKMETATLKQTCLECHTEKFSLHFNFDERVKKVNHSDKAAIANLSEEERLKLLKKVSKNPDQLFDTSVKFVGSNQCASCHQDTYDRWQKSPHGHAFETLHKAGKSDSEMCLKCHTVGFGESSGYTAHTGDKNFQDVGCESCHGPGEKHVQSRRKTDIRGLGDDCPFCVIEQICQSCHDAENSPGFNIHKGLEHVSKDHGLNK